MYGEDTTPLHRQVLWTPRTDPRVSIFPLSNMLINQFGPSDFFWNILGKPLPLSSDPRFGITVLNLCDHTQFQFPVKRVASREQVHTLCEWERGLTPYWNFVHAHHLFMHSTMVASSGGSASDFVHWTVQLCWDNYWVTHHLKGSSSSQHVLPMCGFFCYAVLTLRRLWNCENVKCAYLLIPLQRKPIKHPAENAA